MKRWNTVCSKNQCTGCMACLNSCPKNAITIQDNMEYLNAVIDNATCIECNKCHRICQVNNRPRVEKPIRWLQGWCLDEKIRQTSSSGGVAAAISQAFVQNGGIVCSCCFNQGEFIFKIAENVADTKWFCGSKYVKSNTKDIYPTLEAHLMQGKRVLFIALPCQVAGLKSYLKPNLQENLYIIDLICHGTPSSKLLKLFLKQKGYEMKTLTDISFRDKHDFRVHGKGWSITDKGIKDAYLLGFTSGLIYTENCYNCQFANESRVSDLTLGDAWGSKLSERERKKGISLLVVINQKGKELIDMARIHTEETDKNTEIQHNHQLSNPMRLPLKRKEFFEKVSKGEKIEKAVAWIYPDQYIKQKIKSVLFRVGKK